MNLVLCQSGLKASRNLPMIETILPMAVNMAPALSSVSQNFAQPIRDWNGNWVNDVGI